MQGLADELIRLTVIVASLALPVGIAEAETRQFLANRDVGINGANGEGFTNTGASGRVRGAKFTQHAALFDWDTEMIKTFLEENTGKASVTFFIFATGTPDPDNDVFIETVESRNDWLEGDGNSGCCHNFAWTSGTAAVTHEYAQTVYRTGPVGPELDAAESVPWINDEDGSQFTFMNRGGGGMAMPNFVNSIPLSQMDWQVDEYTGVPLDEDLFNDLINNPENRGLRLAARGNPSNWTVTMREQAGGTEAAYLEVTVEPDPPPPPKDTFLRGDTDASGVVDISDPIFNLTFQFVGGIDDLPCEDAADVDDSSVVDISDPIYNLTFQFVGGIDPPPAPGEKECGPDPTDDDLGCETFESCP